MKIVGQQIVIVAWLALSALPGAAQEKEAKAARPEISAEARAARQAYRKEAMGEKESRWAGARAGGAQSVVGSAWWNRTDVIEALEFTEEQRQEMDRVLKEHLELKTQRRQRAVEAKSGFHEALLAGDLEEAEKRVPKVGQTAGAGDRLTAKLKISVLSQLHPEQYERLRSDYSWVIEEEWDVATRPGSAYRQMYGRGQRQSTTRSATQANPGGSEDQPQR